MTTTSEPLSYEKRQAPETAVGGSRRRQNQFESPEKLTNDKRFLLSAQKWHNLPFELTAGIKQPPVFGFEPYTVKKMGLEPRIQSFGNTKQKKVSYFEQTAKDWKWVPAGIYVPHSEWTK